ncbi:MAG: hypothetical protein ACK4L7_11570, partial [Flavobacteriales bacterium]
RLDRTDAWQQQLGQWQNGVASPAEATEFVGRQWALSGDSGGELAAIIAEQAFEHLYAPIVRVASWDTPVPFSVPLEQGFLPKGRLKAAVERLAGY